jgi:hypothetical protein
MSKSVCDRRGGGWDWNGGKRLSRESRGIENAAELNALSQ